MLLHGLFRRGAGRPVCGCCARGVAENPPVKVWEINLEQVQEKR